MTNPTADNPLEESLATNDVSTSSFRRSSASNNQISLKGLEPLEIMVRPVKKTLRDTNLRWLMLFLITLSDVGSYFCYDNPQPLQTYIETTFKIPTAQANLLYSMMLIPNIIVPFFGGIATDMLGVHTTMIVSSLIVILGQAVVTYGAYELSFGTMVLGRVIFGLGNATLDNLMLIMIVKWFFNKELTFGWGFARSMLRATSALNVVLCPKLYVWSGNKLYTPFLAGSIITVVALCSSLIAIYFDKKLDRELTFNEKSEESEKIRLKDINEFPKLFYILLIICCTSYTSFYGFTINLNGMLVNRFGFGSVKAGELMMIIYLIAAFFSPIVGMVVDRIGKRVQFLMCAIGGLFCGQLYFTVLDDRTSADPNYWVVLGFITFGAFYSMFSTTIWPSIALVIKRKAMGTALGILTCLNSIALASYCELLGFLHDKTLDSHQGYFYTQITQCVVVFVLLYVVFWANAIDLKTGAILRKTRKGVESASLNEQPL